MWGVGMQREIPFGFTVDITYVGRRASICSASGTSTSCSRDSAGQPGREHRGAASYKGYGVIRVSENSGSSKYNSLQISADRRYRTA